MTKLIAILTKETESLKSQYIEMMSEWAAKEFAQLRKWANDYQKGMFGFGEASNKYHRLPHYIINSYGKVDEHIEKMVNNAQSHYETSIKKLAARIEKKGLNQESLNITTSHIGVNIETTLTDGNKTVRAFTIIAGGEIQRPHYRYLIK